MTPLTSLQIVSRGNIIGVRLRVASFLSTAVILHILCFGFSVQAAGTSVLPRSAVNAQKTVMHLTFKDAGKKAGIEIWRIENFEPVPYPTKDYGKFYTGDSYIVLSTKEHKGKKDSYSWDIHFWLGKETSQDESGAAAILAVELDDALGGAPVQYRETQGHETELFLSYFKDGIRYLPGGVSSGFHHSEVNPTGEKKLYQVKGKKNVRVSQVPVDVKSLNKGDCFILDEGKEIYVYVGPNAKGTERLKAISAANQIRDQDHNGRAHVNVVDASSTAEEVDKFFKTLGSGSPKDVADAPKVDDDEAFEKKQDVSASLYKVSDASGKISLDKVEQKPLKKSQLSTDDCFILDTASSSGIYVWIGKKGTTQEKVQSIKYAEDFLLKNKYPSWTRVTRVVEGAEPIAFEQYFSEWRDSGVGAGLGLRG